MNDAVVDDGKCFACGLESAHGIGLRFSLVGPGCVESRIALRPDFQGYANIAHGGIVMTLLDEGMAHAAGAAGVLGVTARIDVRFRAAVPLERDLLVRGNVAWQRRGVLALESSVTDVADRTVYATAQGRFVARGTIEPGALGRKALAE